MQVSHEKYIAFESLPVGGYGNLSGGNACIRCYG
jgi:hypothetical protein